MQQTGDSFFTFTPQQLGRATPCVSRLLSFVFGGFATDGFIKQCRLSA
jgi:hypothetical protein